MWRLGCFVVLCLEVHGLVPGARVGLGSGLGTRHLSGLVLTQGCEWLGKNLWSPLRVQNSVKHSFSRFLSDSFTPATINELKINLSGCLMRLQDFLSLAAAHRKPDAVISLLSTPFSLSASLRLIKWYHPGACSWQSSFTESKVLHLPHNPTLFSTQHKCGTGLT